MGVMSSNNSKSHMVSFRLSNEAYSQIEKALNSPTNANSSVSDYCKQTVERHAFRHSARKYRKFPQSFKGKGLDIGAC